MTARLDVGFTGTQRGMTYKQTRAIVELFSMLGEMADDVWLHHGDCEGSDAQAHAYARRLDWNIHLHPPLDSKKRAFCDWDEREQKRKYLKRNEWIVKKISILVATPKEPGEIIRSGTWSTIRRARNTGHQMFVIMPNGKTRMSG